MLCNSVQSGINSNHCFHLQTNITTAITSQFTHCPVPPPTALRSLLLVFYYERFVIWPREYFFTISSFLLHIVANCSLGSEVLCRSNWSFYGTLVCVSLFLVYWPLEMERIVSVQIWHPMGPLLPSTFRACVPAWTDLGMNCGLTVEKATHLLQP